MIEFKNVSYGYGEEPLLSGLSFRLAAGSFTAVAGENGAGKSTLCRLAAALLRPTAGEVVSNGLCTSKEKGVAFAAFTGFLFQNPDRQICRATVGEEIMFGLRCINSDGKEARLAAAEIIEEFGFSPEREIFYMSRGERQMLALASVLVRRPKILIADEPTSGLDRRQYEFVAERLKEARRRGATVLMVTHDMELAEELADDMLIIGGGAVRAHGPAAGLLSDRRLMEDSSLRLTEMRELATLLGGDFANAGSVNEIVETVKDKRKRRVA